MNSAIFISVLLSGVCALRIFELFWLPRKKEPGKIHARWTLLILSVGFGLTVVSTITEYFLIHRELNLVVSGIGLFFIFTRAIIKFWSAKTLGKYWSPHIEIRQNQKLITEGPYKYVRHPVYLAASIELFAIPLLANSYYTLMSVSLFLFVLIHIRMRIEEYKKDSFFGDEYAMYKKQAWALFPFKHILTNTLRRAD